MFPLSVIVGLSPVVNSGWWNPSPCENKEGVSHILDHRVLLFWYPSPSYGLSGAVRKRMNKNTLFHRVFFPRRSRLWSQSSILQTGFWQGGKQEGWEQEGPLCWLRALAFMAWLDRLEPRSSIIIWHPLNIVSAKERENLLRQPILCCSPLSAATSSQEDWT